MSEGHVSIAELIQRVKAHPRIAEAGMILSHNGIVRASNRSGSKTVTKLRVSADFAKIEEIRAWAESQEGIICVLIQAFEGDFTVGDDLLYVVVAGDIRENVFRAMRETVERVKAEAVTKQESYL